MTREEFKVRDLVNLVGGYVVILDNETLTEICRAPSMHYLVGSVLNAEVEVVYGKELRFDYGYKTVTVLVVEMEAE